MSATILVVEDETSLQETLKYNLERAGYQVLVEGNGSEALSTARQAAPDLILMDIMLPGLDGVEVTRILRQEITTPIIMLTAKDEEIDRVLGLEIGADDYLTKPFSMRELMARVKAQLRRVKLIKDELADQGESTPAVQTFGNLTINHVRREVELDQNLLSLKPKEYDLLHYLGLHQGQVLSRDQLLQEVWGWDYSGGSRTVDVHVRWLREKIEPDPSQPQRIVTIRGIGYRFEG
jgi:DNA-binding response OmpR family regulator